LTGNFDITGHGQQEQQWEKTLANLTNPTDEYFESSRGMVKAKYHQLCLFSHKGGITTIDIYGRYQQA